MTMEDGRKPFRYSLGGQWFKGGTHIHSTASDGGKTFGELEQMYAAAGYDFAFATDHRVVSRVARQRRDAPLLWLDGVELDGQDESGACYHVVCLGTLTGIDSRTPFTEALQAARRQKALTILAHPFWSGNTLEEATRPGFDGVEIYNHVCRWLNGKDDGRLHWNAMLARNPATLAFAADDAHLRPEHPGWNGGWIVVNAARRSRRAIMDAIRRGRYYSSCGPEFQSFALQGDQLTITTSPVRFARLAGPGSCGARRGVFSGKTMRQASFTVPADWPYAYLEIEDRQGRRAWTNTLFAS